MKISKNTDTDTDTDTDLFNAINIYYDLINIILSYNLCMFIFLKNYKKLIL